MKKPTPFGKYLLLERVNVGGMAEIFIAKAFGVEGFERILAIKKILPTMAEDEEFITMFIDEARISVQLSHANIVHIHELGRHNDAFFIAMEYVAGKDLRAVIERFRRRKELMPTAMAAFVASKMCEGLDYAHRKKDAQGEALRIIHRDVSPQNILLSYDGEVKLIDFGIAKAANRSQKTQAGILKGKFGYMSPEQVRGLPIDHRSDIFAVGVVMYEMLTGEKLFVGESDFSTLEKVRNADVPVPTKFNPDLPAELEKVLLKALARDADERYQWASELHEDLMRFLFSGDAIYSAKNLGAFTREAFAEDLLREDERMKRFASVDKPEQLENSAVSDMPKRKTPSQAAVVSSDIKKSKSPTNDALNIPPPTAEELAEMEVHQDRTVIVDPSTGQAEEPFPATVNSKPLRSTPSGAHSSPVRSSRSRAASMALMRNGSDTGGELKPLEMTGFQPALLSEDDERPAPRTPKSGKSQLVIGDAPISGATSIGPSPYSQMAAEEDGPASTGDEGGAEADAGDEYDQAASSYPGDSGDSGSEAIDTESVQVPVKTQPKVVVPAKKPAKAAGKSSKSSPKKSGLLLAAIGLAGVIVVALAIGIAMKLKGPLVSHVSFKVTPSDLRFVGKIAPGNRSFNNETKVVDLPPGEYVFEAKANGDEFRPAMAKMTVPASSNELDLIKVKLNFERIEKTPPPPTTFTVQFASEEDGVELILDGKSLGKTPYVELKERPLGKPFAVVARKPGFADATIEIANDKNEPVVSVPIALNKTGAQDKTQPVGSTPDKTGKDKVESVDQTPSKTAKTDTGASKRADSTPKKDVSQKERVDEGTPIPKRDTPAKEPVAKKDAEPKTKAKGNLACTTTPLGAEIWADGKNTGMLTPVARSKAIELTVGRHSLFFKLEGKSSTPQSVMIEEGKITVAKFNLVTKGSKLVAESASNE